MQARPYPSFTEITRENAEESHKNPQTDKKARLSPNGHFNPAFQSKKPFLTQVKQRAINGEHYKDHSMHEETTQRKTNASFTAPRGIAAHSKREYVPSAEKARLDMEMGSRVSSKEKYCVLAPRVDHLLQEENRHFKEEIRFLKEKAHKMDLDFRRESDKVQIREEQLRDRSRMVGSLTLQLQEMQMVSVQYHSLMAEYHALQSSSAQLKENQGSFLELKGKYMKAVEHCQQLESILRQKDQYLQNIILNKTAECTSSLNFKTQEIKSLGNRVNILEHENQKLGLEVERLLAGHSQSKDSGDIQQFQVLSREFEVSINELTDENGRLKSTIGQQEGRNEELGMQLKSLEIMVKAFEESQEMNRDSALYLQISKLRTQIEKEQEMSDMTMSKYELEILVLQNEISTKQYETHGSLLDFSDNENLLSNFSHLVGEVERLKAKVGEKR